MGTNYYWRFNQCGHCNRYNDIHVGKSSGGWSFLFRAWQAEGDGSPFNFPITSRAHWRAVFTEQPGELFDQYGSKVDDPVAWIDALEAPDAEQQRKELLWLGGWLAEDKPRDPEGFRTYGWEFS